MASDIQTELKILIWQIEEAQRLIATGEKETASKLLHSVSYQLAGWAGKCLVL